VGGLDGVSVRLRVACANIRPIVYFNQHSLAVLIFFLIFQLDARAIGVLLLFYAAFSITTSMRHGNQNRIATSTMEAYASARHAQVCFDSGQIAGRNIFTVAWLTMSSGLPWLYFTIMFLIAGWVRGALMWLVSMWRYRHRRQPSQ
jgi:hypothetical protein